MGQSTASEHTIQYSLGHFRVRLRGQSHYWLW